MDESLRRRFLRLYGHPQSDPGVCVHCSSASVSCFTYGPTGQHHHKCRSCGKGTDYAPTPGWLAELPAARREP